MKRYDSQSPVTGGYYFNTSTWKIHGVEGNRGVLPGVVGTQWVRLATPVMVLLALGMSLGFVLFLPALAIGLFAWVVALAVARSFRLGAERLARTFAPNWVPGEAWLARRDDAKKTDAAAAPAPGPESLEGLRREVDARRAEEDTAKKDS